MNNRLRLRFATSPPHEHFYGGDTVIGDIFHSVPTDNIDPTGSPLAAARRVVFSPPAGIHRISLALSANRSSTSIQAALKKVLENAADLEFNAGLWYTNTNTESEENFIGGSSVAFHTQFDELQVESDDRFYWILVDHNNTNANLRGFMRLEKLP